MVLLRQIDGGVGEDSDRAGDMIDKVSVRVTEGYNFYSQSIPVPPLGWLCRVGLTLLPSL